MIEEKIKLLGIKLSDTKSSAVGSFTQVVISGNLAFVSGQIPIQLGSNPVEVKFKGKVGGDVSEMYHWKKVRLQQGSAL